MSAPLSLEPTSELFWVGKEKRVSGTVLHGPTTHYSRGVGEIAI